MIGTAAFLLLAGCLTANAQSTQSAAAGNNANPSSPAAAITVPSTPVTPLMAMVQSTLATAGTVSGKPTAAASGVAANSQSTPAPNATQPGSGPGGNVKSSVTSASTKPKATTPALTGVCAEPMMTGPCTEQVVRWYYNRTTRRCEILYWGGCQENGNNFYSIDECVAACPTICSDPVKVGSCRGQVERYYYNSAARTCEKFIWSGCQPNKNNFLSLLDCELICGE